jgi:methionyl-tRNA synthetase
MMFDYTTAIIVALVVWEMIWKGFGTWRAGKNNQLNWFIAMFVLNTAGILPIIYLKFYQKKKR